MIRCNELFHLLLSFGKRDTFFVHWCIINTTTIRFPVIKWNTDNYCWSHRKVLRREGLVQGQLITKCYLLLNHPGNRGDGSFASRSDSRVWKTKSNSAAGLQRYTVHVHFSWSFLFLSCCKLWMYCMLKFSMSKNWNNNNLGLKMQIQMETIKRLLTLVSLTEVNAIGSSSVHVFDNKH